MLRCVKYITVFIFLMLIGCASRDEMKSSKEMEYPEEIASELAPALEEEAAAEYSIEAQSFETGDLTVEREAAFLQRAAQKAEDFSDYLGIITNANYDQELRAEAGEQMKSLFVARAEITDSVAGLNKKDIAKFVKGCVKGKYGSIVLQNFIVKSTSIDPVGATILSEGEVKYDEKNRQVNLTIRVHFIKADKQFGQDIRQVWTVLLGDVVIQQR